MTQLTFQIENNIPVPDRGTKSSPYPLREMSVGQSIFVPEDHSSAARTAAAYVAGKTGWKFLSRKVVHKDVEGLRIWRQA